MKRIIINIGFVLLVILFVSILFLVLFDCEPEKPFKYLKKLNSEMNTLSCSIYNWSRISTFVSIFGLLITGYFYFKNDSMY